MPTREKHLIIFYALGFFLILGAVSLFYLIETYRFVGGSVELTPPVVNLRDLF